MASFTYAAWAGVFSPRLGVPVTGVYVARIWGALSAFFYHFSGFWMD